MSTNDEVITLALAVFILGFAVLSVRVLAWKADAERKTWEHVVTILVTMVAMQLAISVFWDMVRR